MPSYTAPIIGPNSLQLNMKKLSLSQDYYIWRVAIRRVFLSKMSVVDATSCKNPVAEFLISFF